MKSEQFHICLENIYETYNCRHFVSPDPLQFLYAYDAIADREVAGLVASTLAYGKVCQIVKKLNIVFGRLGPSPSCFLRETSPQVIKKTFADFRHRFTTGDEIGRLLIAIKRCIKRYGSLCACFTSGMDARRDETILPALNTFVETLKREAQTLDSYTLPLPSSGSACKRLNLFLRWMIRKDAVDPGGWDAVPPSKLVVPLDTHMFKIGSAFGFTRRGQADLKTALEITGCFRRFAPDDPARYDFALTRFGIRDDCNLQEMVTLMQELNKTIR